MLLSSRFVARGCNIPSWEDLVAWLQTLELRHIFQGISWSQQARIAIRVRSTLEPFCKRILVSRKHMTRKSTGRCWVCKTQQDRQSANCANGAKLVTEPCFYCAVKCSLTYVHLLEFSAPVSNRLRGRRGKPQEGLLRPDNVGIVA